MVSDSYRFSHTAVKALIQTMGIFLCTYSPGKNTHILSACVYNNELINLRSVLLCSLLILHHKVMIWLSGVVLLIVIERVVKSRKRRKVEKKDLSNWDENVCLIYSYASTLADRKINILFILRSTLPILTFLEVAAIAKFIWKRTRFY